MDPLLNSKFVAVRIPHCFLRKPLREYTCVRYSTFKKERYVKNCSRWKFKHRYSGPVGAPTRAWRGKRGGELWVVSKADGSKIAGIPLETPLVSDGMIAFKDRIYISLMNGNVICLKNSQ